MPDIRLFDAHCYVGRYKTFRPGSFYRTQDLIEQMQHYNISEALVTHSMSREHHPVDGNVAVLAETLGKDNLHPCWAVLPPRSGEMLQPALLAREMISKGVRAARIFYGVYTFPISEWCIGSLLDEFEAHRIPVFIDPDKELSGWDQDRFDWDAVNKMCGAHPQLPIILSASRFRSSNRLLYQLLDLHQNLHIELSGYWGYRGIEFITREFGAGRLIFGTRMPVRDPACAISQLLYSEISDKDKQAIAGDNLRLLLGGVVE